MIREKTPTKIDEAILPDSRYEQILEILEKSTGDDDGIQRVVKFS
jgi:hypothetical protein